MRKVLLGFGMLSLGIMMVVSGCSSSTDSELDTEAMSESMKAQTDMMVYNMGTFFDDGIDYMDQGAGLAKPADTAYYVFDEQTYWWTYTYQYTLSSESMDWTINELDSIRFSAGSTYQMEPDSTTDGLEIRIIGDDLMTFAIDSTLGAEYDIDFVFENANTDTITVDGTFDYVIEMVMGDFEFDYDFDCGYSDIKIVEEEYSFYTYPIDGSMTIDATMTSSGDPSGEIPAGTWTISIALEFNPDGYSGSMTIEGDNFTWESDYGELSQLLPVSRP